MAARDIPAITEFAKRRLSSGLTQTQVGLLLGLSQPLISMVENGKREPWPKLRRDAARLFRITEHELFPATQIRDQLGGLRS
jgi:transcriptional regulator with XRE-family HTH domain